MKALIVDDEPLARNELQYLLNLNDAIDEIEEAENIEETLEKLLYNTFDLIFLDINLMDESGIDLAQKINKSKVKPGNFDEIKGIDQLDKIIDIDQSPIGRTPRSNPATYTGVFDDIRDVFAQTNEAKIRGYQKGRFSFNVKGGRCEACKGDGIIKIEMHFLPDVYVPCEVCDGKRYNRETLEVTYKGKNIADVLEMTVEEATHFFENIPKIKRKLQTLVDVGLG